MRLETFDDSTLGRTVAEGLRLDQLRREFPAFQSLDFSVFDVAAFYALSTPSEEYIEELQFAMTTNFLTVLRAEICAITDVEDAPAKVDAVVRSQFERFAENIPVYRGEAGKSFTRKLRTIVRAVKAFAEEYDMFELATRAVAVDDTLRTSN